MSVIDLRSDTSSPVLALAIASSMPALGWVTVSLRRSDGQPA